MSWLCNCCCDDWSSVSTFVKSHHVPRAVMRYTRWVGPLEERSQAIGAQEEPRTELGRQLYIDCAKRLNGRIILLAFRSSGGSQSETSSETRFSLLLSVRRTIFLLCWANCSRRYELNSLRTLIAATHLLINKRKQHHHYYYHLTITTTKTTTLVSHRLSLFITLTHFGWTWPWRNILHFSYSNQLQHTKRYRMYTTISS